jgi:hypothetical protein
MQYEKNQNLNPLRQDYKIVAALFVVIIIVGCSTVKYTATLPKQPNEECYSLSKEGNHQIGNIDTAVIYVNEQDWIANGDYGSKKKHLFVFMKFASNGIAFYSDYDELPFTEMTALSKTGQFCHYRVINDELELEYYSHSLKKFTIMYGSIFTDRIIFYKDKLRILGGGKDKLNLLYQKSATKYTRPLVWPE